MSGFAKEWLALREDVDRRSRNPDVANALAGRFALRDHVTVVDLGAGTGSNLRATAGSLPSRQTWILAERDPALIETARSALKSWAERASDETDGLRLVKGGSDIAVKFVNVDLAKNWASVLAAPFDLVTASAFFDLTSVPFIKAVARATAALRGCFYATLTYNGIQRWSPHRPLDNQMSAAFHRHQLRDKGFGPSAGPEAASYLADHFKLEGYSVIEGDSPWRLDRNERMLIEELVRGHAFAVAETGLVADSAIEGWVKVQRAAAEVGHTDIFAAPA